MKPVEAPPIDPAIVEWLDIIFPNTMPREGTDTDEINRLWGQRRVVDRIKAELARQLET